MEAKKFVENDYDVSEEYVFVKRDNNRYEFYLFDEPGSMWEPDYVTMNGETIAKGRNATIKLYNEFGLSEIKEEAHYTSWESDDENENSEALDKYNAAFNAAKAWLNK